MVRRKASMTKIYVLTETRPDYSFEDVHVIGAFDSYELASAARDGHAHCDEVEIFAVELNAAVQEFDAAGFRCESVEQIREREERDAANAIVRENANRKREAADLERQRRASELTAWIANVARADLDGAHIDVMTYVKDFYEDTQLLIAKTDANHAAKLPALTRRLTYYARQEPFMRGMLTEPSHIVAFDMLMHELKTHCDLL